jgi:tetratricopeptide (TPR) repeat protein
MLPMIVDSNHDNKNITKYSKFKRNNNHTLDLRLQLVTLQKQFEALLLRDSTGSIATDNTTFINDNNDCVQDPINKRPGSRSTYTTKSNIPSSFVSTLKDLSLWSNDTLVHVPPILTSLERKRRVLEIELLQNLIRNDDETIHQLWSLWYCERGNVTATKLLYDATTYSNDPNTWNEAEHILRTLILQYGIYWVEPVNRLATLYYIQGKYKQSIDLCTILLSIKPWHFGALSGMVGLYIQRNDVAQAKIWSEKRLPSYVPESVKSRNSNQRRIKWVTQAVSDAKQSLNDAEQQLQYSFGKTDPVHLDDRRDDIPIDVDTASWQ